MLNNLTGWHFLIILVVVLLLFGAPKLPGLAKSIGQSMHIFKREVKSLKDEDKVEGASVPAATTAAAPAVAVPLVVAASTAAPVVVDAQRTS